VNISSLAGAVSSMYLSPYSSAKAAVNQLTQSLAREYAPKGRLRCLTGGNEIVLASSSLPIRI